MPACCSSCGSSATVGAEVASVCTDCAAATVTGFTVDLPLVVAGAFATAVIVVLARRLRLLPRIFRASPATA